MNIFYINESPALAAQELCNIHVNKMALETAQMLSTAHRLSGRTVKCTSSKLFREFAKPGDEARELKKPKEFSICTDLGEYQNPFDLTIHLTIYRETHQNHPSTKWVRSSSGAYKWAWMLFKELCREYHYRTGKVTTMAKLIETLAPIPENLNEEDWTDPPLCMPDEYKSEDHVEAYRKYYISKQDSMKVPMVWTGGSQKPEWFA